MARYEHNSIEARRLLTHYLRTVWEKSGLNWDADNDAEIDILVEALIDAAHAQ